MNTLDMWNAEAEQSLLASLLIDPNRFLDVQPVVEAGDFYRVTHRELYEAIGAMYGRGAEIDLVTVADELIRRGSYKDELEAGLFLSDTASRVPTALHVVTYARTVARYGHARRLIASLEKAARSVAGGLEKEPDELSVEVESIVLGATQEQGERGGVLSIAEVMPEMVEIAREMRRGERRIIPANPPGLSELLGGWRRKKVYVVAARPGGGKTSFMLNNAAFVAANNLNALVFSLEMDRYELAQKIASSKSGVDSALVQMGPLDDEQMEAVEWAAEHIARTSRLWIDDASSLSWVDIKSRAMRLKHRLERQGETLDFIAIDYLQIMRQMHAPGLNYSATIGITTANLKAIAKELDVPILVGSQLSRESEKEHRRPRLSDLRDSGSIEADADVVIFPYCPNPESDPDYVELGVAKHRGGPKGIRPTRFFKATNTWGDPTIRKEPPPVYRNGNGRYSEEIVF